MKLAAPSMVVLLAFVRTSPAGDPAGAFAGTGAPGRARLAGARATLEKLLLENHLPFWLDTLDRERGGYRLNHDGSGRWLGPAEKSIVSQARNVWFFARISRTRFGRPEHLPAARHGYEFLRAKMWDAADGGFFWSVDAGGAPARTEKHLYGQAFGLYALSEYAIASGDRGAADLAGRLFRLLEDRAHDGAHGGYRESFARGWTEMPAGATSPMGLPSGLKLMNTHLHLMEALTAYVRLSKDPLARERLLELITIQSNSVVRKEAGVCSDRHRRDWSPLRGPEADRVSYGHDIENVWLLMDACDAAGVPGSLLADLYRTLFASSLRSGFDSAAGGFWDSGPFGAPADRRQKVWWVQAEALVATLRMHRLLRDPVYFDAFEKTLDWVANRQADRKGGSWHEEISPEGAPRGGKAHAWKAGYHDGRALIECLLILDAMLEG